MSEEFVNIEIDGVPVKARKGSMLIEAADREGALIPRFCYHEKLSVAANCRMCLVDVERAPKPLPACATPVTDGMKVFTKSPRAIAAQKATMEFLLINHPLDCPICDQGGECELQDVALGYGSDVSRFAERKRSVKDKDIGPLISTDMTRCIHCTRCVRFGTEIAGIQELGATGRGERMEIGTYVARSVDHELSGNVIDLCPVGALNNKPFRFRARTWEMLQTETVAPHDCLGSNLYAHSLRGRFLRAVPRTNEAINEVWLSDRDRFSCEGVYSPERLERPLRKIDGEWREIEWDAALEAAADVFDALRDAGKGAEAGFLASPSATLEELYLTQRIARGIGCNNIDHRLRQADFRDAESDPVFPALGRPIAEFEALDAALVVGSNLRKEVPLLAHRLRKAALKGARVMFINPRAYELLFPVSHYETVAPDAMAHSLAQLVAALVEETGKKAPAYTSDAVAAAKPGKAHAEMAAQLVAGAQASILLGQLAMNDPHYADVRALAAAAAELAGATLGYLPGGGNAAGAALAGVLPHREAGGKPAVTQGLDVRAMMAEPRSAYLLVDVEPERDCWDSAQALEALAAAPDVVMLTPFVTETMKSYATLLLPMGTFGETAGTLVNAEGNWQSFTGASRPLAETRPGWKILRVLGSLLGLEDFEYHSPAEVRDALRTALGAIGPDTAYTSKRKVTLANGEGGLRRATEQAPYAGDSLQRRAQPLQETADSREALALRLGPADAKAAGVADGERVRVVQDGHAAVLRLVVDESQAAGWAWLPGGVEETAGLGPYYGAIEIQKI